MNTDLNTLKVKGNVLIARLKFIREHGGEKALQAVLKRLPPADVAVLNGIILPISWYPMALNLRLDEAIAAEFSPDDKTRIFIEMGRASADTNLTGPHHAYLKAGDPHHLLAAAPQVHRMYYAVGTCTYEKTGPSSCILRACNEEMTVPADCLTLVGWYQRAIEMCGGRDVVITKKQCRAKGQPHCEYVCQWR